MTDHTPPDSRVEEPAGDWSAATFDGARREQVRRWSQLSLREVIAALEEMEQLAATLGSATGAKPAGTDRP